MWIRSRVEDLHSQGRRELATDALVKLLRSWGQLKLALVFSKTAKYQGLHLGEEQISSTINR